MKTHALLIWKNEATQFKTGGEENKKIIIIQNNTIIEEQENHPENIKRLEKQEIPFIDTTQGQNYPPEITGQTVKQEINLGVIRL